MAKYNKSKFYWLQLKEDFFDDDAIDWLEDQENGKDYVLFYIKLCLKSLKYEGILIRSVGKMLIPYDDKKLATMTKTNIDTVKVAMVALKKIGLVKVLENGELYLSQVKDLISFKTIGADKKQKKREEKKEELKLLKCDIDDYINLFNKLFKKNYTVTKGRMKKLGERLKKYSMDQILDATENIALSPFHRGLNKRGWQANPDFLIRNDEKIDEWLNYKPDEAKELSGINKGIENDHKQGIDARNI